MPKGFLKDALFCRLSDLSNCFPRKKFYSIRICVRQKFKPMSFYIFLLHLPASCDMTQSRFRCRNLQIFLKGFQIIESFSSPWLASAFSVYHVIELASAWIKDSRSSRRRQNQDRITERTTDRTAHRIAEWTTDRIADLIADLIADRSADRITDRIKEEKKLKKQRSVLR